MRQHTMAFYTIQYYAIVIQRQYRANTARRKAQSDFVALKRAAIVIQAGDE